MLRLWNEELPKKYSRLNIAQDDGIKIGLTREQVLTYNFGSHTIFAIKKDVEKGVDLQKAFEKYSRLNIVQVDGIKIGLTREQVSTYRQGPPNLMQLLLS